MEREASQQWRGWLKTAQIYESVETRYTCYIVDAQALNLLQTCNKPATRSMDRKAEC
jgi:hypothetical protein